MARTTLGIITCDNQIICPRVGQCVDVFQVPDQSCARIARPLGRRPAAQLEKSIVYGIQTNSAEVVTFGDLSTRSTLHFAIEHCNKAQPVPLGRLKLRSKKKDKHDSVHNLLSKLRPGQRAVACVRGVALLRWREGDEWAAYHLLPLWTLHRHRDTVLPLLLRVLGWLPPDTASPFPDPLALPRPSPPPIPGLPTIAGAPQPSPPPAHHQEDPYALPPHAGLCRGVINFTTADWAAVNEQGRTVCYRDPVNFHLDPWTAPAGALTGMLQGAPEEEEEGTISEMLAPEHHPEYILQVDHPLLGVAVRDPANPSLLRTVSLDAAVEAVTAHGPGALFWHLHNLQAVGNVLHLQLLLGREEGQEDGPGCSQRGGWEALVHNGQQLELWASSAEGAPFLVVRPEVAGGRAPAGVGTSEEEEQGGNGDGDGEEELRVVGELGEERLGVLQGAGGANVAVTLAPGALKMLVGCYCGDVVFSRGALREGEEVLKQLLRGLPAVEEAVMPGEEEVKMEEDVPGPVSAAPQEVALLAVQQQLGQGQQQQGQVQQGQQGQPQGLVEFLHAAIDESVQRRRGQEDARQQGGLLGIQPSPGAAGAPGEQHRVPRKASKKRSRPPPHIQVKVCSNCSTTDAKFWRTDKQGNRLCNACGLYQQKNGVARPPHMWELDAVRPGSRVGGPQRQTHGRAGGGSAGRGKGRGIAPLRRKMTARRTVPGSSSEEAVSSDGGMEDEDDMEEPDPSGVDNDGNYPAGNAHKRARLDPGASGTGLDDVAAALVGLAAGASPGPGTQGEVAGVPAVEAANTPRHGAAEGAAEALAAAAPRAVHGLEQTEQQQGADVSMKELPNGEKQAGAGVGLEARGRASRPVQEGRGAAVSQAGAGLSQAGAGVLRGGLQLVAVELGAAAQRVDRLLDAVLPSAGSREVPPGPFEARDQPPPRPPLQQQRRQQQPRQQSNDAEQQQQPGWAAPYGAVARMADGGHVGHAIKAEGSHNNEAGGSGSRGVVQVEGMDAEEQGTDTEDAAAEEAAAPDAVSAQPPVCTDVLALCALVAKLQSERRQMALQVEEQREQRRDREREVEEQRRRMAGLQAEVKVLQEEKREAVGAWEDERAARERTELARAGEARAHREALAAAEARFVGVEAQRAEAVGRCTEAEAARDRAVEDAAACRRESAKQAEARRAAEEEARGLQGRVTELEQQSQGARAWAEEAGRRLAEAQAVAKQAQEQVKRLQGEALEALTEKKRLREQKKALEDRVDGLEGKVEEAERRALEAEQRALEAELAARQGPA